MTWIVLNYCLGSFVHEKESMNTAERRNIMEQTSAIEEPTTTEWTFSPTHKNFPRLLFAHLILAGRFSRRRKSLQDKYKRMANIFRLHVVLCHRRKSIFRKVESSPSPNVKRDIKGKCVEWITRDGFGTILFCNNVNHSVGEKIVRNILDAVWYDVSEPYPNVPRDK